MNIKQSISKYILNNAVKSLLTLESLWSASLTRIHNTHLKPPPYSVFEAKLKKDYFSSSIKLKIQPNLITSKVKSIGFTLVQVINTTDAMEDSCLLCLEVQKNNEEFWDGIKANTRTWQELNIKTVLEKHFWPLNEILLPTSWICLKCWQNVRDFHKFYLRVEEAQIHAGKLRTIKTELQSYDCLEPGTAINQPQSSQDVIDIKTEPPFDEPDLDSITSNQIQSAQTKFTEDPLKNSNQTAIEDEESKADSLTYGEEWQENEPEDSNSSSDNSNQNVVGPDGTTPEKIPSYKNYRDNDIFIMEYFKQIFCDLCKV
ncbi:hypothetical protein DOY81_014106, partial [Sarcophaga bullata]